VKYSEYSPYNESNSVVSFAGMLLIPSKSFFCNCRDRITFGTPEYQGVQGQEKEIWQASYS